VLTLHDYQPSLNGWKVRVLMGLLGTAYRTRELALFQGETRTEAFLELNPVGAVPVLELEDGRAIAESNAILFFLADGSRYLPQDRFARAKVIQWLSFEQYYIEPTIGSLRFWTLTGRLGMNGGRMTESRRENAQRALAALERTLGGTSPFLVGGHLTIADIGVYAYTHRAGDCGFAFEPYPALSRWLERIASEIGPGYPVPPYTADAMLA
jgi:glutathione S-transferase